MLHGDSMVLHTVNVVIFTTIQVVRLNVLAAAAAVAEAAAVTAAAMLPSWSITISMPL